MHLQDCGIQAQNDAQKSCFGRLYFTSLILSIFRSFEYDCFLSSYPKCVVVVSALSCRTKIPVDPKRRKTE
eukprot:IDg17855t1